MLNFFGLFLILVAYFLSFLKLGNFVDGKNERVITNIKGTWILDVIAAPFIYWGVSMLIDGGWVIREIYIIGGEPMTLNEGFGFRELVGGLLMIPSIILLFCGITSSKLQMFFSTINALALIVLNFELLIGLGAYLLYYAK